MHKYDWMCLYKQDSENDWVVNMPKFWIWQGSQYVSVTQCSQYARISYDRVLNVS